MFEYVSREIANFAHVAGLCLVLFALFSIVRALERGDLFGGLMKAGIYAVIGSVLMKL